MVKLTKEIIKKIGAQDINPGLSVEKISEQLTEKEKVIVGMMLINIVIGIVNGFYVFVAMENFLTLLYKETYA